MNRILTIKKFKQNIAELCEEVGFGVALKSAHHPENDGVVPESLNAESLETIEIEIPMNERLKELAEQSGMEWDTHSWCWLANPPHLMNFAKLVRNVERKACADHYLQIMRDAIEAARLDEREACAKLCVEWGDFAG